MFFFHLSTGKFFWPQVGYGIFTHRGRQVRIEVRELLAELLYKFFGILAIRLAVERARILEWGTTVNGHRVCELRFAEVDERANDREVLA